MRGMGRGLTLIELVAAMAVFALVAIMGLQALSGSLRLRDALVTRADQGAALARAVALVRQDLSAALPLAFFPPGAARPQSAVEGNASGFRLSRGGLSSDGGAPRLGRVEYTLEGEALQRRVWPTPTPATPGQLGPALPVMGGVVALRLRSYWPPGVWAEGLRPPQGGAAPRSAGDEDGGGLALSSYSSALPLGIEVTLVTRDFGEIVLVESLK